MSGNLTYICIYIFIFMLHVVIVLYCERVAEGVRKSNLLNIKIPLTLRLSQSSHTKIVLEDRLLDQDRSDQVTTTNQKLLRLRIWDWITVLSM